ncbi:MAG: YgiQ family radical SAM protein [Desulfuromonadia bacterium]
MGRKHPLHLPTNQREAFQLGWGELDIILVTGDAYIDHPSFGVPLLGRYLVDLGFRVGIIPQPDWRNPDSFRTLGAPRLFFGVSSGALDSMVAHYTPRKKLRHDDAYTPGGLHGARPNRAVIVYSSILKGLFRGCPIVIGGIEASLRRLAHYDYWDDRVRRSILLDSKADLLVYGMGERPIREIAVRLAEGEAMECLTDIRGTAYLSRQPPPLPHRELPPFEEVAVSRTRYAEAFRIASDEANPWSGLTLVQRHGDRFLIVNPPSLPLSTEEMDHLYGLSFSRLPHPRHREPIPAMEMIRTSVTSHRGCAGGCAFCAITHHQGRTIQSRSFHGIIGEVERIAASDWFTGTISDVGGPTANMYRMENRDQSACTRCRRTSCMYPSICPNLVVEDVGIVRLLERLSRIPKVRNLFVSSGIRYDLLERQPRLMDRLVARHVGGVMKVAPESLDDRVLMLMRKPPSELFRRFLHSFREISRRQGKRQGIVPYLVSGHPGATLDSAVETAIGLRSLGLSVDQIQEFTPTPGTLSTCIYWTGIDPYGEGEIPVPRTDREKILHKEILLSHRPGNLKRLLTTLRHEGRGDLADRLSRSFPPHLPTAPPLPRRRN